MGAWARSFGLSFHCLLRLFGIDGRLPLGRGARARLPDQMYVLGRPREAHLGASSGKARAIGLVRVRDEDGHRHVAGEAYDDLRSRAQVNGRLDHPLDGGPAVTAGVVGAVELKLLRADDGV